MKGHDCCVPIFGVWHFGHLLYHLVPSSTWALCTKGWNEHPGSITSVLWLHLRFLLSGRSEVRGLLSLWLLHLMHD